MTGTDPTARIGRRDHERAGADRLAGGLRPRGVRLAHLPSCRWPSSCAAWPCPVTERMRATRRPRRKPARGSASRPAPSRSPSAVNTSAANARAGVPGRPVVCAVPRGHLTLSAAPPASLTHHHHPHRPLALHPPLSRSSDSSGRDRPLRPCYAYLPLDFTIRCATQTREYPTPAQAAAASGSQTRR